VNGFNVVNQPFIAMYNNGCHICYNWSRLKPGSKRASTPKYNAADKHATTSSHFKLPLGQPVLR